MAAQHTREPGPFALRARFLRGNNRGQRLATDDDRKGDHRGGGRIDRWRVGPELRQLAVADEYGDASEVADETASCREQRSVDRFAAGNALEHVLEAIDQRAATGRLRGFDHLIFFPGERGVLRGEPFVLIDEL